MKITFFINGLSGGGAERVICNLSNYLVCRGHQVVILTFHYGKCGYYLDESVIRCGLVSENETEATGIKYVMQLRKKLKEYLLKDDSDCYVSFLPIAIFCLTSCKKNCKGQIIVSERNDPGSYNYIYRTAMKWAFRRANKCVFQTENVRNWYGRCVDDKNAVIIPNAINKEFISFSPCSHRKKEIISVGRLVPQKNFELLIRAFAKMHEQTDTYSLTIYGEGPLLSELKQLVNDLGISDKVSFPGFKSNIESFIKDASLFVLSSNFEGMPNSLIEAMAIGLPCIATDCDGGGARYLIKNGENGLLVKKNDLEELTSAMLKLLNNPHLAESISTNAIKICDDLAPKKIYSKWEDAILDL